ncbi:hypothetical protein [Saccharothrix lopnurensis]|uniref:Transposase n=1 Tax=Saccharothrix lopnurensis TaxID=1670621 RepID=A0ABW1P5H6_9PSEU
MASRLVGIVDVVPIDRIADELYALPPAGFVAARDAHARRAARLGDQALAREIAALRKPTASAWALNSLARETDVLVDLLALGEELRAAEELRGNALRQLGARRRVTLNALARQAEDLARAAGHPLGPEAVRQVRATLVAACADRVLAARIRIGRLVRPVERAAFPPVGPGAVGVRDDLAPRGEQRRERQLAKARGDVDAARSDARRAEASLAEADRLLDERAEHAASLRAELQRAQRAEHAAAVAAERARRRADTARDRLARAQRRVTELRGDA